MNHDRPEPVKVFLCMTYSEPRTEDGLPPRTFTMYGVVQGKARANHSSGLRVPKKLLPSTTVIIQGELAIHRGLYHFSRLTAARGKEITFDQDKSKGKCLEERTLVPGIGDLILQARPCASPSVASQNSIPGLV